MASICVFCGSHSGGVAAFTDAARLLAEAFVERNHQLVYGGGGVGLMGTMADTMLARSGSVVGVIPHALAERELLHVGVGDMRIVPHMHARKAAMHELADAYIALPGGFGTLEELFEVLCWRQLEFHRSPVAILNLNGFYNGLRQQLRAMADHGFLAADHLQLLHWADSTDDLIGWLDSSHFLK